MAEPARRNVEFKARLPQPRVPGADPYADFAAAVAAVGGAEDHGLLRQQDTFFAVPRGRLKLREETAQPPGGEQAAESAVLIAYARGDDPRARLSQYHLVPVPDPDALRTALAAVLPVGVVIRKARRLWIWQRVRIHLDRVAGLGDFVELEAVLDTDEPEAAGHARLARLRDQLRLTDDLILARAYAEMIGGKFITSIGG